MIKPFKCAKYLTFYISCSEETHTLPVYHMTEYLLVLILNLLFLFEVPLEETMNSLFLFTLTIPHVTLQISVASLCTFFSLQNPGAFRHPMHRRYLVPLDSCSASFGTFYCSFVSALR